MDIITHVGPLSSSFFANQFNVKIRIVIMMVVQVEEGKLDIDL